MQGIGSRPVQAEGRQGVQMPEGTETGAEGSGEGGWRHEGREA